MSHMFRNMWMKRRAGTDTPSSDKVHSGTRNAVVDKSCDSSGSTGEETSSATGKGVSFSVSSGGILTASRPKYLEHEEPLAIYSSHRAPVRGRRGLSNSLKRLLPGCGSSPRVSCTRLRMALLFTCVVIAVYSLFSWALVYSTDYTDVYAELDFVQEPKKKPWSILVQHEDAVERLEMKQQQQHNQRCGNSLLFCDPLRITAAFLPSWTLRVIDGRCKECLDMSTYRIGVKGVRLQQRHGVFATSAAPLGRVGPMLLAMASVTDDVNVRTELQLWEWLRYVYGAGFPTVDGHAEAGAHRAAPYLAVLGIPSTDQPARAALREAQRQTWLTYQEVARRDNRFTGALLPLYLFAAVEPLIDRNASIDDASVAQDHAATSVARKGGMRILLPTTTEYRAASDALMKIARSGNVSHDVSDMGYAQRRVELRKDWRFAAVDDTPCASIITTRTNGSPSTSALSYLSSALSVPVTPAFTSPAELICHASSALWQEALTHRNVLWIDMMTDRRPTTNKRLGEDGKWGLPVEVGMSQKLILWLEYAYHAFPTVPFIIKGDDDAYVKVPQFLSDVRYVMGGTQVRQPSPPPPPPPHLSLWFWGNVGREGVSVPAPAMGGDTAVKTYMPQYADDTKCLYWGSGRRMGSVRFNAGMLFLLHRRLVQVILEPPQNSSDDDFASLAVQEFTAEVKRRYMQADFQHEDVMIGAALRRRYRRAQQLCHGGSVWYVKEGFHRFHDLHRGKIRPITWSTVVAHRCQPADAYFLHHYFQNEYATSTVALEHGEREEDREKKAIETAREWVAGQLNHSSGNLSGWESLPLVEWTHSVSVAPAYVVVAGDGVAVYESKYEYWNDNATSVFHGYQSRSFDGRQGPLRQYRARRRGGGTLA